MVHYKLTYFNGRGLAEVSRQLFHLAGVPFEDHRVTDEEFQKLKPNLPTGQVPILYIDGVPYHQSTAIARFLAKKFGFAGKTSEEELQADSIVDTFKDFIISFRELAVAILTGNPEVERIREDVAKPAAKIWLAYIFRLLEKNKSGFLVGNELTWADLVAADSLTTCLNTQLLQESASNRDEFQKLSDFRQRLLETSALRQYFANRPQTLL